MNILLEKGEFSVRLNEIVTLILEVLIYIYFTLPFFTNARFSPEKLFGT